MCLLYLIEILHQTTTAPRTIFICRRLYLIEILHQTTTPALFKVLSSGCILSKFYIKPQRRRCSKYFPAVVSYRNSTSNHNSESRLPQTLCVVSYRNSTSNHNGFQHVRIRVQLYLIEILHQTTTLFLCLARLYGCILSKFYIKPQHGGPAFSRPVRCILSKFYIKPQQPRRDGKLFPVVSYRNSTSNHNNN